MVGLTLPVCLCRPNARRMLWRPPPAADRLVVIMAGQRHQCVATVVVALTLAAATFASAARAEEPPRSPPWPSAEAPAYPGSPYHGATNGDGQLIPCRCRFQGQEFRLGEEVCMSTHLGVVLARCDLMLNNTSWVPTSMACTISQKRPAGGAEDLSQLAAQSSRSMPTIRSRTNVTR